MVNVYVWEFRGKDVAWGHASMKVGETYISWWPMAENRQPTKIRDIYSAHPIRDRTFMDDQAGERGKKPDHDILLQGLDEPAIKDWWQTMGLSRDGVPFQGPLLPWKTLTQNCSTIVATGLYIGGGNKYASWVKSHHLVWTPNDVLHYAQAIQKGLAARPR